MTPTSGKTWERTGESRYRHTPSGTVVYRDWHHFTSSHAGIWVIVGERGHQPTLRDAKARVEKLWEGKEVLPL